MGIGSENTAVSHQQDARRWCFLANAPVGIRLCIIMIALLLFLPGPVFAQQVVRVIILPFEIHAQEELSYLQAEIPKALKRNLEAEGAKVMVLDAESAKDWKQKSKSIEEAKNIGIQFGSDYVLWGSLTWIGKKFSLDARLIASVEEGPASDFTAEGEGVQNLPATVKKISREIGLKIFKREKIAQVVIEGNSRIEDDAIRRVIQTQPGDIYLLKNLSEELKRVYEMGYFDDIRVEAKNEPEGKVIIFKVKEKPTVRGISVDGNTYVYEDEEILEVLNTRKGSILNIYTVQNDMRRIEELYKEKNYHNVQLDYKIKERPNNQADIEYVIEEGEKLHIEKIKFVGNNAFSDKQLRKQLATAEKNWLSIITTAGDLDQEFLTQDVARLTAFYHNNGYIRAKVGEPKVEFEEESIVVTFKIEEGPQFEVGEIDIAGDLLLPKEQMLRRLDIGKEEFYNRETLRKDVLTLTDLYSDEGYAYADIAPQVDQDPEKNIVNITFEIDKGKQVYFEEIIISGNTKTRDKVIRRELRVYEQELYSGSRLKRSIRNLYRLDFFEDIQVNTVKGSANDKMKLQIDVKEKNTGAFSFGAGYGNVESFFGTGSIAERNFLGRGQTLQFKGQVGAKTQRFTLSFLEPYLFYMPLSAGFDIYRWFYSFNSYDKDSIGGSAKFGYPVFDYTRLSLTYIYDIADITNVDDDAASSIKRDEGENRKSSIVGKLRWDSRNDVFHPTRGSINTIESEYAGLGGTVGFLKTTAESVWYFPLYKSIVGVLRGAGGYIGEATDKDLPDYEKFYMTGVYTMRGFQRDDLSPQDDTGAEIGGTKFVMGSAEIRFPLVKQAGVYGLAFFDTGDIYATDEDVDLTELRESAGLGIRWLSPVGPIQISYGWILDSRPEDSNSGNWEFTMATLF